MRCLILVAACLVTSASLAKDFYSEGCRDVFTVTNEILAGTPRCDPLAGELPVSAAAAIRIAAKYHSRMMPKGRTTWHVYELGGATLVRAENERWYWIVQFRGLFDFDPHIERRDGELPSGGYSYPGPKTTYNRYPVLMTGQLAPHRPRDPKLPAAIRPVSDNTGNDG